MPQDIISLLLLPSLVAFFVALLGTPLLIKIAPRLGIMDYPTRRHPAILHTKPTPRGGGIPVLVSIGLASVLFLPLDQRLLAILIGALAVVAIGFLDDRRDTNPYMRLVAQFIAAGVVVAAGIGIAFITNPLTGGTIDLSHPRLVFDLAGETHDIWIISVVFGLIWIVTLMNAVSWSSGVDGQLSGFSAIAALVIALASFKFSADITQWPVTILAAITFGAFLGFLPWHIYPQKIMPGFGGATLAGFMLAVLSILTTTKVGTLLIILGIPITDAAITILRRVLEGKSPVWGDRKHLHHRLLDAGWSKQRIAVFYWSATAILGILALNLNTQAKFYTMVGVILFVGGLIVWVRQAILKTKQ